MPNKIEQLLITIPGLLFVLAGIMKWDIIFYKSAWVDWFGYTFYRSLHIIVGLIWIIWIVSLILS